MRFPSICWRVTPPVKIAAALTVLFVLITFLILSVQASSIYIVDNDADIGSYAMTVIDGKPVMAYYDAVTKAIKLSVCANAACETSTSTITTVVSTSNAVTVVMTDIGGYPFIAYSDPTAKQLKTAACFDLTCSASTIVNLVTILETSSSEVKDVININGKPLIVFLDVKPSSYYQNASLKTAACSDALCSTPATFETLHTDDDSDWSEEFHAAYSGGYPIISFLHEDQLKLGVCANLVCSGYASWRILDSEQSALDSYSNGSHGLTFINGNPLVVYQTDEWIASPQIRTVACSDPTCLAVPILNKHNIPLNGRLAATTVNNRAVITQTSYNGLIVSTCTDDLCSSLTTMTLPTSDFGKRDPKIVSVGGYPGITYLHSHNSSWLLSYYYDGDYTPVQPPTPSLVPTATFTPLPTLPPTLPPQPPPQESVTPVAPAPTLSAPSSTVMLDSGSTMPRVSMALDHQGLPVIAYRKNNEVWLARCTNGSMCNPHLFLIGTTHYASDIHLAIGSSDIVFISYVGADNQYNLVACDSPTTCDTTNRQWAIDGYGAYSAFTLLLDRGGNPVLAHLSDGRILAIVRCESPTSCNAPTRLRLFDPLLGSLNGLAMGFDDNNVPMLAYSGWMYGTVRWARCESATTCDTPTITTVGAGNSWVDLEWVGGVPVIGAIMNDGYHGTMVNLIRCESAVTCDTPTRSLVDAVPYSSYNSGYFLASDASARPVLTYIEGGTANNVRLAYCDSPLCTWPDRLQVVSGGSRYPTVAIDSHNRIYLAYTKNFNDGTGEKLMLYMGGQVELPPLPSSSDVPYRNYFTMHGLTLTWGVIPWAAGYEIQIDDSRDFRSLVYSNSSLSTPSYQASFANGTYFWRVRAKRSDGNWGSWSAVESFVVSAP